MMKRFSLLAALIALVAIGGAIAWTVVAVPRRAREMAIAAASAAFGREVTAGRVSGNPWTGLVVEDVIVAASPPRQAPPGRRPPAILTIRRMTLYFNPFALAGDLWGGRGPAASLSQIILDEPALAISRDRAGVWNIANLFPKGQAPGGGGGFTGRFIVLNGSIALSDGHRLRPSLFAARFEDVNFTADFSTPSLVRVRASFVEERGERRVPVRVRGTYAVTRGTLDLDVSATGGDAGVWGPYLITNSALRITGGQFDTSMHILQSGAAGGHATDFQGQIVLRDGSAVVPKQAAVLAGIRGRITIANQSVSSDSLRGTLNGAPMEVRGEASIYDDTRIDLALRTSGINLTTLQRLFFPRARVRVSGIASGEARITGFFGTTPRVEAQIDAARGQFDAHAFDQVVGRFSLYGETLSISGNGRIAGGQVSGQALWSFSSPSFLVDMRLDGVDAARLSTVSSSITSAIPKTAGRLSGSFTARGKGGAVRVVGQGSLVRPRLDGLTLDTLDAAFASGGQGLDLHQVRAQRGAIVAYLHGQVSSGGALALRAHANAVDVATLPGVPRDVGIGGQVDALGMVRGTLADPVFSGDVQVARAQVARLAFDTAGGHIALRPSRLDLDAFTARSGRARYWATGAVRWAPQPHLALTLETERGSAATLAQVAGLPFPVTGSIDGRVHLEGPPTRPSVSGSVSMQGATIHGQAIDEATAAFRSDGIRLTVEQASLRRRSSVIELAGTIDRRTGLDLGLAAQRFDLRDLTLPPLGSTRIDGHLTMSGRITGQPASPRIALSAASENLTINGIRFDRAAGELRWEARALHMEPLTLQLRDERYEITGNVGLAGPPQTSLSATVTTGRLSTLLGLANVRLGMPLDATISGLTTVEGPMANPAARLDLRLSDGRFGDHRVVEGHVDLTLREGSVTIEEFLLRPVRGTIVAQGRLNLRGENQIEIGGSDLDLDILRPVFRLRRPLLGRLNFTTQLAGTLASPEIGFSTEIRDGGIEGATFNSLVANAFYRDGLLQLQQALLVQNGHKLRASGEIPFNPALGRFDESRPINLRLELAEVNLGLLRLATDRVEEAVGAVEGEVRVSGTVRAPRVEGRVAVQNGRVRVRSLRTPIEALRLDLRFDESAIRVAEATARIGGGTARLEGGTRITSLPGSPVSVGLVVPEDAPLVLTATDLRVDAPPFVNNVRMGGALRAWGTLGDPRRPPTLEGGITVSDGVIAVAAGDVSGAAPRALVVFRGIRFDAGPNLAVRVGGLQFDLQAGGSVLLTGTPRAPMLDGTFSAQQGKISALGTLFDLREGTATFVPHQGLRPRVFAEAETQVGATRIFLTVRGIAPDALELDLASEPDLPRREILALIGQQAGISRLLAGDVEGALRAQISRFLFGQVSLGIGRAIGLSELVIEYDFSGPFALRAGRLLFNDLYWTVTTAFTDRPLWTTGLEYRFSRNWTLSLRLDSEGRREAVVFYSARF